MLHYFTTMIKVKLGNDRGEFGLNAMLGVAMTMIIAAFVVMPTMKGFAQTAMDGLNTWWSDTISTRMFPTT